jgi:hypothetical protein
LKQIRQQVHEAKQVATTLSFGPQYVRSSPHTHRKSANSGVFLLVTGEEDHDFRVSQGTYGFAAMKEAQARRDFEALVERGRRVLWVHLAHSHSNPAHAGRVNAQPAHTGSGHHGKELERSLGHLRDLVFAALAH